MRSAAFLAPPSGLRACPLSGRRTLCGRRPRGGGWGASGAVASAAPTPTPDDDDEFFLPALDVASLTNNTVLGAEGGARAPPTKPRKNAAPDAVPTLAQQRIRQSRADASARLAPTDTDHDFIQAAREAIAMAAIPADVAGVADISTADVDVQQQPRGPHSRKGPPRGPPSPAATPPRSGDVPWPQNGALASSARALVQEDGLEYDVKVTIDDGMSATGRRTERSLAANGVQNVRTAPSTDTPTAPSTEEHAESDSGAMDSPASRHPDFVIRPSDLVMHARHGLGRFRGLERSSGQRGPAQEYAVVEYRDGDVYVPLSQLDCLRRLTPAQLEEFSQLDVVSGSASYANKADPTSRSRRAKYAQRQKARAKIREQIVNLSGLYAARDELSRPKYRAYLKEEAEFMTRCNFELTEDQALAVKEVLNDISKKSRPMDRLLCGDVGFGKTEVAMRCAFRVLLAGKQIAVLAPTTILAQQHYETFRERFEPHYPQFPVVCLTRFLTRKATLETRARVTSGEARIIIGTHVLLGETTKFQNLGLLVVDEEHRFGVNQKEKLRCKHRKVDTLFMSATPIPRTLHLAVSGLRDTSILKQPPPGRKPVITRVAASGSGVVRKALAKEFERDGQVFFVCPRIEGIEATAAWINELFPSARVLVAHGAHKDLERRIWAFACGRYDVLVCTTIIENGINMPRVNTMIVQDAARFGMAQLHQLRGRVGRCDLQAYAWLLYTQTAGGAPSAARERLRALERFSGLGAGFAIAQRDMEMRGVGTVLGVDQHGYSSVDADEYSQMLIEELESARSGKPVPMKLPAPVEITEIFLPVASYIPSGYVTNVEEKMAIYSMMSTASTGKELSDVVLHLERRYGPLPAPVHRHMCIMRLKLLSKKLGIRRILVERDHVVLDWAIAATSLQRLVAFLQDKRARARFECIEAEERVNLRGLGICTGDLQLAKLLRWLDAFVRASVDFKPEASAIKRADDERADLLGNTESDENEDP